MIGGKIVGYLESHYYAKMEGDYDAILIELSNGERKVITSFLAEEEGPSLLCVEDFTGHWEKAHWTVL